MSFKAIAEHKSFKPGGGAALAVLFGLVLWGTRLGDGWTNSSYDYLFRFGSRAVTNQVVLILMDNEAHHQFHQERDQPWDRALHAQLLNKLADDGCPLVVFDVFFEGVGNRTNDAALADAMSRQRQLVLMAEQAAVSHPHLASARPILPAKPFLSAAHTNWGVAWLDPGLASPVRQHWPFPSPGPYPSLPWTAAEKAGAHLGDSPQERWLRYYGLNVAWISLSYPFALTQTTNFFRDKAVFVGNRPATSVPDDGETDEFRTPYTRWTGESVGGVEILATEFLNLLNSEWLRRPPWWAEVFVLAVMGTLLGGAFCHMRLWTAAVWAAGAALAAMLGAVCLSYFSNYWFPWLVIAGGQVPCALGWAMVCRWRGEGIVSSYEVAKEPFGKGAYGEVFLARHKKSGEWVAFKKVYKAKFNSADPYEREFRGITRYLPVSSQHEGLLQVRYVGRDEREGYFFYVMELGDALSPGWEKNPATYAPRDLGNVRKLADGQRLPVRECMRIGLALAEALSFLHRNNLLHRDIKPQNIIFVKGQPKFADVGLVAEISPLRQEGTWVGTPDYMPPSPEPPGTPQADIYGLGMVLYVLSTGQRPAFFPDLSTTLVEKSASADFIRLNAIILKACQPDSTLRYTSAAEMRAALLEADKAIDGETTTRLV